MAKPPVVLFVCTGNMCRSVMAAAMLEARAQARNVELEIVSAGLAAEGVAPPRRTIALMRDRGLDVSGYRSRRLSASLVADATVVLGAERVHAWEAVALQPDAVERVFTFAELVRLAEALGPPASPTVEAWIDRLHASRRRAEHPHGEEDIADPYGRSRRRYKLAASEIESLVDRLATLMLPLLAASGSIVQHGRA